MSNLKFFLWGRRCSMLAGGTNFSSQTVAWRSITASSTICTRSSRPLPSPDHFLPPTPPPLKDHGDTVKTFAALPRARTHEHTHSQTRARHTSHSSLHHSAPLPSHVGRKRKKKRREQTTSGLVGNDRPSEVCPSARGRGKVKPPLKLQHCGVAPTVHPFFQLPLFQVSDCTRLSVCLCVNARASSRSQTATAWRN